MDLGESGEMVAGPAAAAAVGLVGVSRTCDSSASPENSSAAAEWSAGRSASRDRASQLRLRESSLRRRGLVGVAVRLVGGRGVLGRTERLRRRVSGKKRDPSSRLEKSPERRAYTGRYRASN